MIKIIRLATLALCFGTAVFAATPKTVRVIYLVSADRQENPVYTRAIADAAVSVQNFFRRELGGTTYRLNNPIVEVVKSDKEAAWFYGQARRGNVDNWGYDNTLDEVHRLLGAKHDDPDYVWVIYSDGPGSSGRGGGGVCIMPENDLLGLTGKRHNYPDPPGAGSAASDTKWVTPSDYRIRKIPKSMRIPSCGRVSMADIPIRRI